MIEYNFKECEGNSLGTGLASCMPYIGYPVGGIRVPRNWSLDVTSDSLDEDYIKEQVQLGNFTNFTGSSSYDNNTPESVVQEFDSGAKFTVRNGKIEFVYHYVNGKIWDGIAQSYNSNNSGAWIFVYQNDTILVQKDGDTISGFKLNTQNASTYKNQTGSEVGETMLTIQLKDEVAYNKDFAIIGKDALGFDISDAMYDVTDAVLTADDTAAGANLNVAVKYLVNTGSNVGGLVAADFRLVVNDAAATISAVSYNDVTEKYEITPDTAFTASDVVYVELYDANKSIAVADAAGGLFKGTSNSVTVTA